MKVETATMTRSIANEPPTKLIPTGRIMTCLPGGTKLNCWTKSAVGMGTLTLEVGLKIAEEGPPENATGVVIVGAKEAIVGDGMEGSIVGDGMKGSTVTVVVATKGPVIDDGTEGTIAGVTARVGDAKFEALSHGGPNKGASDGSTGIKDGGEQGIALGMEATQ